MIPLEEREQKVARQPVSSAFEDYSFDARWWTGPVDKIQNRLAEVSDDTKELAVIVTTGAFCPIHQGHVQMLENAKRELESRGLAVLGGYICPDHDRYVSSKIRSGSLSAAERLELCELAVENSDWLMIDRWAAIYASSAVNFTTIVGHIDKMVNHHIKTTKPIRIVYAFGGDNAMFAFSFTASARWSCVCVLRPGSLDRIEEMVEYDSVRKSERIIFSHDITAPLDSTSVRKGDLSGLLPKVKSRWLAMQARSKAASETHSVTSPSTGTLRIRNEGIWAIQPFLQQSRISVEDFLGAYNTFCEELQNVFKPAFDYAAGKSPSTVTMVHLRDHEVAFQQLLNRHKNIISLDPCLPGTHDLRIAQVSKPLSKSTSTSIESPQASPLQDTGTESISYTLFTEHLPLGTDAEQLVTQHLSTGSITRYLSHLDLSSSPSESAPKEPHTQYQGTINARDFLVGSHEGGTVLQLDDAKLVRAPTILPYVRPAYRAHIDLTTEMGFSKAVWGLNQQFFQALRGQLAVKDMAPGFQVLCEVQGFPADMRMAELCEWHLEAFKDMVFKEL